MLAWPASESLDEAGSGMFAQARLQESRYFDLSSTTYSEPEQLVRGWGNPVDFAGNKAIHPLGNQGILDNIKKAKLAKAKGTVFTYTIADVTLYSKL
jgi:hypothetical protein